MSTVLHVGTYLQIGDDFDSRYRYLRSPANGVYEGRIVAGGTWGITIPSGSTPRIRFKIASYEIDFHPGSSVAPVQTVVGVTSV